MCAALEHFVSTQITHHGYLAVFLLMVAESACIPVPSEAIMLFGGALSAAAFVSHFAPGAHHLNVAVVGVLGTVGNVAGSIIAYWVGRVGGRPVVERWGGFARLGRHDLDRAERFFARRGEVTVLVARVLPLVRTFISLPAGVAEMPFARFVVFTTVGCLPWTFALALTGHAIGNHWTGVSHAFAPAGYALAAIALAAIAWWLLRRRAARPAVVPDRGA